MSVETHLEAAAAYIAVAESGDSERAAYEHAADEIIAAQKDDPALSFREIDRRLGRAADYTGKLVRWRTSASRERHLPFGGEAAEASRERYRDKQTLRDPERRQQAIASLTPEERVEVVRTAMSDPEVEQEVERDVETKQAERKFEQEQRRAKPSSGTPLSAYFHRLIGALRKTTRDLEFIRAELDTLNETERPRVDEALVELIATAESCRLELNPGLKQTGVEQHGIIEGHTVD